MHTLRIRQQQVAAVPKRQKRLVGRLATVWPWLAIPAVHSSERDVGRMTYLISFPDESATGAHHVNYAFFATERENVSTNLETLRH